MITDRMGLDDTVGGFDTLLDPESEQVKILVKL